MYRVELLAILLTMTAAGAEGLQPVEYFGNWTATYSLTRGESNTLWISDTLGAKFVRDFGGAPETQELMAPAKSVKFVDDLLIIDFRQNQSKATYKLVLAGFENPQHDPLLRGTAYMYLDGVMVNGMHIAFRKTDE